MKILGNREKEKGQPDEIIKYTVRESKCHCSDQLYSFKNVSAVVLL